MLDAKSVGVAACRLGAGRLRKEDTVSVGAGVRCLVRQGDRVEAGQPLFEAFADDPDHLADGTALLEQAVILGEVAPAGAPLVLERIGLDDAHRILEAPAYGTHAAQEQDPDRGHEHAA